MIDSKQDEAVKLEARADAAIAEDRDHMNFAGTDRSLSWLVAQLACWPNRVDEEKTTNLRFLMVSAAVTLRSLRGTLTPANLNAPDKQEALAGEGVDQALERAALVADYGAERAERDWRHPLQWKAAREVSLEIAEAIRSYKSDGPFALTKPAALPKEGEEA